MFVEFSLVHSLLPFIPQKCQLYPRQIEMEIEIVSGVIVMAEKIAGKLSSSAVLWATKISILCNYLDVFVAFNHNSDKNRAAIYRNRVVAMNLDMKMGICILSAYAFHFTLW